MRLSRARYASMTSTETTSTAQTSVLLTTHPKTYEMLLKSPAGAPIVAPSSSSEAPSTAQTSVQNTTPPRPFGMLLTSPTGVPSVASSSSSEAA